MGSAPSVRMVNNPKHLEDVTDTSSGERVIIRT